MRTQSIRSFKRYYTLMGKIPREKRNDVAMRIIDSHSGGETDDIKLVTKKEYDGICTELRGVIDEEFTEQNKWRRMLLASIHGFMKAAGKEVSSDYVIGIALRASGEVTLNDIPRHKLIALYNAFLAYQRAFKRLENEAALLSVDPAILKMCGIEVNVRVRGEIKGKA